MNYFNRAVIIAKKLEIHPTNDQIYSQIMNKILRKYTRKKELLERKIGRKKKQSRLSPSWELVPECNTMSVPSSTMLSLELANEGQELAGVETLCFSAFKNAPFSSPLSQLCICKVMSQFYKFFFHHDLKIRTIRHCSKPTHLEFNSL